MRYGLISLPLLCGLVMGCGSTEVAFKAEKVEIPIAEPCDEKMPAHPEWPLAQIAPGADIFSYSKAALKELDLRKAYEVRLEAALQACLLP